MYTYAAITDIGPRAKENDDGILVADVVLEDGMSRGSRKEDYFFAAICDGVGGLARGSEAARICLQNLAELNGSSPNRMLIRNKIEAANDAIREHQRQTGQLDGMRTTLAGISVFGRDAYVFNAGDSRVYLFRNGILKQLSKDHSLVQDLIDTGKLTKEEAVMYPRRNVITKCLGEEDRVNARIVDMTGEIKSGDLFLLCTDGLTDCVKDEELEEILRAGQDNAPDILCRQAIDTAIENGSTDNISVCIFRKEI